MQAPNSDIWIERNTFTGNGPSAYVVLTDGYIAGYVQRFHFRNNWVYGNTVPSDLYFFDVANSDITGNHVDQNNQCAVTYGGNNGVGYAINLYSEAYDVNVSILTRASNVVTAVAGPFAATWPLNVGDQMLCSRRNPALFVS